MTQIERRQARIRRIKQKMISKTAQAEDIAAVPDVQYHIGKSQNHHEHIPSFLQAHEGDPAIRVGIFFACSKYSC
jgi:hypothetical protein